MGSNGEVVDIERVQGAYEYLGGVWGCGELLGGVSQSLCHIDSVLPQDSIQLVLGKGTPVQCDVCGVDGIASGIEWMTTRS